MSDVVSVEVNTVQFTAALQRLQSGVRAGFIDPTFGILSTQGRLLAERCQEFTPPRNVGQGRAAVTRDIQRIFKPLSHRTFTNKVLRKIVQRDNRPSWNAAAQHFKGAHSLQNTTAMGFSEDWHQRNRDQRGRAKGFGKDNLGKVTLGQQGTQVRRYLTEMKKHVGWAKAGWNAGILGLGGVVKASWVARHSLNRGKLFDGRSLGDNAYIRVLNDTGWAKYGSGEGERILNNAIRARARDMQSYYERMMRLAAKKAGFAEAA